MIGSGFISGAQIQIAGTPVTTTFVSATELSTTTTVAPGTASLAVTVVNPTSGNTASSTATATINAVYATVTAAARLLDQATFGPTITDIQHVQKVGIDGYITEQFSTAQTVLPDIAAAPTAICTSTNLVPCEQSEWWQTMLTGPDQLRQRVAFALSEIFVVSTNSVNARSITTYQNILAKDAFTNFSTIMNDVTLSPAMGGYLNMLNSNKPAIGQIANENYARELMQLFSTGIDMLNQDGTLQARLLRQRHPCLHRNPDPGIRPRLHRMDLRLFHRWHACQVPQRHCQLRLPHGRRRKCPRHHREDPPQRNHSPRRPDRRAGPHRRPGEHLRTPQCRPLHLPPAHPAPRLQQSQPCLRLADLRRLREQWQQRPRRHAGSRSRHP